MCEHAKRTASVLGRGDAVMAFGNGRLSLARKDAGLDGLTGR